MWEKAYPDEPGYGIGWQCDRQWTRRQVEHTRRIERGVHPAITTIIRIYR